MADDLFQLYQDVVLEHNRNPRNYVAVDPATHRGHGYNPLCGDSIELTLDVRDGFIHAIGFQGESCAIATASASLLTETLQGRPVDEAKAIAARFGAVMNGQDEDDLPAGLEPLRGVRRFPSRVKCARLAWASLEAALAGDGEDGAASTEVE
ncbi:SUF system NifU family Fe-S cluster assembly protein [Aquisalimonas sp. 2447]|uniref:Fe-S cluster assembly sulfur transfer protein SufU n=1 Tax=Aquisalimonas sp. 2447 TaxID=2740807 RepID=UPI0014323921|nr:SUF system NifU family Fe-S cluster assembly protein [Aquisalimonas sp. 2447]QIT56072.1 SUF system NifU family Fe-S cluster assembly protein [Aquisalimonas sp. 2447]